MQLFSSFNVIICNPWVCVITALCDGSVRTHIDGILLAPRQPYLFYLRRRQSADTRSDPGR